MSVEAASRSIHHAWRGVLILLVMLDHNDIVRNVHLVDGWFLPMTFHVSGFLFLPFLGPPRVLSWRMAADHAVRYLVPFVAALLLYGVLFRLWQHAPPDFPWLLAMLRGLVVASPWLLKDCTGYLVLWFLPALLSCVLLRAGFHSAGPVGRALILALAVLVHLGVGALPVSVVQWVPQGWLIALYIFPLGLLLRHAVLPVLQRTGTGAVVALAAALLIVWGWWYEFGEEIEIATLALPDLRAPLHIVATDSGDLLFMVVLLAAGAALARLSWLRQLGAFSLVVYLVHPLLYKPVFALLLPHLPPALAGGGLRGAAVYWACAAASVVVTAALSLLCARVVDGVAPLRRLLTPRDLADWRAALPRPRRLAG